MRIKNFVLKFINESNDFDDDFLDEKLKNIGLDDFEVVNFGDQTQYDILFKDKKLNIYFNKLCDYKKYNNETYQDSCLIDFYERYNELIEIKFNKKIVDKKLGFGSKVYKKLINDHGFIVGNRLTMSPYSKKVWERFKDSQNFYYIELTRHHFLIDKNLFSDTIKTKKLIECFIHFMVFDSVGKNILNVRIPKAFKKTFQKEFKKMNFVYGFNDREKLNSILNKVMINPNYDISKYEGFMIDNNHLIDDFALRELIVYNPKLFDKFAFVLKYGFNKKYMNQIALERPELKNKIDLYIRDNKSYFDA